MSVKGWEALIKLPVKQIVKERMIDVDGKDALGDGAKTDFWTRSFPVTTSLGVVTDDETLVTIYFDGVAQGSGTYTLTGVDGKVVFGTPPAASKVIEITFYSALVPVGYAENCNYNQSANLEAVTAIGSRAPSELKEGFLEIAMSIERCCLADRNFFGKVSGPKDLPEFDVDVCQKGVGSGLPYTRVTGKFTNFKLSFTQSTLLLENAEFKGRVITTGNQA